MRLDEITANEILEDSELVRSVIQNTVERGRKIETNDMIFALVNNAIDYYHKLVFSKIVGDNAQTKYYLILSSAVDGAETAKWLRGMLYSYAADGNRYDRGMVYPKKIYSRDKIEDQIIENISASSYIQFENRYTKRIKGYVNLINGKKFTLDNRDEQTLRQMKSNKKVDLRSLYNWINGRLETMYAEESKKNIVAQSTYIQDAVIQFFYGDVFNEYRDILADNEKDSSDLLDLLAIISYAPTYDLRMQLADFYLDHIRDKSAGIQGKTGISFYELTGVIATYIHSKLPFIYRYVMISLMSLSDTIFEKIIENLYLESSNMFDLKLELQPEDYLLQVHNREVDMQYYNARMVGFLKGSAIGIIHGNFKTYEDRIRAFVAAYTKGHKAYKGLQLETLLSKYIREETDFQKFVINNERMFGSGENSYNAMEYFRQVEKDFVKFLEAFYDSCENTEMISLDKIDACLRRARDMAVGNSQFFLLKDFFKMKYGSDDIFYTLLFFETDIMYKRQRFKTTIKDFIDHMYEVKQHLSDPYFKENRQIVKSIYDSQYNYSYVISIDLTLESLDTELRDWQPTLMKNSVEEILMFVPIPELAIKIQEQHKDERISDQDVLLLGEHYSKNNLEFILREFVRSSEKVQK